MSFLYNADYTELELRAAAHVNSFQELLASIRAVDPEARVVMLHDVIEVECRTENRERILHMLTGGLIFDEAHRTRVKT